jgi:hypothetical protein
MRSSGVVILSTLLAASAYPARGQFRGVDIMLGSSAGVISSPVRCESCQDITITHMVGLRFLGRYGIGYRAVRWGENGSTLMLANHMASDLITLEYHPVTQGRIRPFLTGGQGKSSVYVRHSEGGHQYEENGPSNALPTSFFAAGIDFRVYKRLAITPSLSTTKTTGGSSSSQWCTQGNYLSGDFSYSCTTTQTSRRYSLNGFAIGIGIR